MVLALLRLLETGCSSGRQNINILTVLFPVIHRALMSGETLGLGFYKFSDFSKGEKR